MYEKFVHNVSSIFFILCYGSLPNPNGEVCVKGTKFQLSIVFSFTYWSYYEPEAEEAAAAAATAAAAAAL